VAAGRGSSETFAKELPSKRKETTATETPGSDPDPPKSDTEENLKIAWRYKDSSPLPITLSSRGGVIKGQKGAKFEFTQKCTASELGALHLTLSRTLDLSDFHPPTPLALLQEIAEALKPFDLTHSPSLDISPEARIPSNLIRVGLSHCETQVLEPNFMLGLRALVRSTNSCAVITVSNLSHDQQMLTRLEHLADSVIHVQVFLDERKKAELGDVDGLCSVVKINSINSLKLFDPPTDLGFSFRKKRITFQVRCLVLIVDGRPCIVTSAVSDAYKKP
jgi:hypothetical protein